MRNVVFDVSLRQIARSCARKSRCKNPRSSGPGGEEVFNHLISDTAQCSAEHWRQERTNGTSEKGTLNRSTRCTRKEPNTGSFYYSREASSSLGGCYSFADGLGNSAYDRPTYSSHYEGWPFAVRVNNIHGIIEYIKVGGEAWREDVNATSWIRRDKPSHLGVIPPCPQVIEAGCQVLLFASEEEPVRNTCAASLEVPPTVVLILGLGPPARSCKSYCATQTIGMIEELGVPQA
jgi:hypothetical protein